LKSKKANFPVVLVEELSHFTEREGETKVTWREGVDDTSASGT